MCLCIGSSKYTDKNKKNLNFMLPLLWNQTFANKNKPGKIDQRSFEERYCYFESNKHLCKYYHMNKNRTWWIIIVTISKQIKRMKNTQEYCKDKRRIISQRKNNKKNLKGTIKKLIQMIIKKCENVSIIQKGFIKIVL